MIDNVFSNRASVSKIIVLAQVTDPHRTSSVYEGVYHTMQGIIKKRLRCCDRYELVTLKKARIVEDILILRAIDHSNEITCDDVAIKNGMNSSSIINGYTDVDSDATSENYVELIFYENPERDVVLHCNPKN